MMEYFKSVFHALNNTCMYHTLYIERVIAHTSCSIDPGAFNSRSPVRKRSASFRRISRIKKKEEKGKDSRVNNNDNNY